MLLKDLIRLLDYNSSVIVYQSDRRELVFTDVLHVLYISNDRDKNIKGFDDLIDLQGDYEVLLIDSKDDYLEITIYKEASL